MPDVLRARPGRRPRQQLAQLMVGDASRDASLEPGDEELARCHLGQRVDA